MIFLSTLRELHLGLGARLEETPAGERVLSYGDPGAEHRAIRLDCGLFDASDRGKLRLAGSERIAFLHGMVTQDVKRMADGRARYAVALTPKGHLVSDLRVVRRVQDLLIDTEPGVAPALLAHLDRHLISEDVRVEELTGDQALFSFVGPGAAQAFAVAVGVSAPAEGEARDLPGGETAIGWRLGRVPRIDVLVPSDRAPGWMEGVLSRGRAAGLVPVGFAALEVVRVEEGVARFGVDMDEETLAMEAGLADAISYDKGCYVGQEQVARVSFRGQVRRRLAGLAVADARPPAPRSLAYRVAGEARPAAEVRSGAVSPTFGAVCLAYVRREHLAPGTRLVLADGRGAEVRALPFG